MSVRKSGVDWRVLLRVKEKLPVGTDFKSRG